MDFLVAMFAMTLAQSTTVEAPLQPQEREICRRVRSSTSRMDTRRICKTATEWARSARSTGADHEAEEGIDPLNDNPTTRCVGGMGGIGSEARGDSPR